METSKPTKLSVFSATAVVVGCVIGSGVFVKPGRVLAQAGSSDGAILAWIFGGLMTLAGGLTVAEIAFRIPKTGGVYVFVEEIYGKALGFISGWVQAVIYAPGLIATLALIFGSLVTTFFGWGSEARIPIALSALVFLTFVGVVSAKYGSWIQNSTTLIKLIPVVGIGVAGLIFGKEPVFGVELPASEAAVGMGAAVLSSLWAYDGWMSVTTIAGEIENPSKNLPRAIIFGLSLVAVAYLLVNLSLFHVIEKGLIVSLNENAAGAAAVQLFGPIAGKLLSLGILFSIFGCLNGQIMTLTRVPYAMATHDVFPMRKTFAKIDPRFQTPLNSILLIVAISIVMILGFNPDRLSDLAVFSMYLFYGLIFLGIFKIRKKFGVPPKGQYRIPFYPLVPIIAFFGVCFICSGMIRGQPWDAVGSVTIAALGLPVYLLLRRKQGAILRE